MLEIYHFLPWSFGSQYYQNYCSKTVVYGVYGQLKIKKIKYKSCLGFRLSSYSFKMPKTNPGHNGPPPLLNVFPEHTLNRVKLTLEIIQMEFFMFQLLWFCQNWNLQDFQREKERKRQLNINIFEKFQLILISFI